MTTFDTLALAKKQHAAKMKQLKIAAAMRCKRYKDEKIREEVIKQIMQS